MLSILHIAHIIYVIHIFLFFIQSFYGNTVKILKQTFGYYEINNKGVGRFWGVNWKES